MRSRIFGDLVAVLALPLMGMVLGVIIVVALTRVT